MASFFIGTIKKLKFKFKKTYFQLVFFHVFLLIINFEKFNTADPGSVYEMKLHGR